MLDINGLILEIPSINKDQPVIPLDMAFLRTIEGRIKEIANANPASIASLITDFTLGMTEIGRFIAITDFELRQAKNRVEVTRAVAILDKADGIISSKGLKSSADLREAVVTLDPEFQEATTKMHKLTAVLSLLDSKRSAIEAAYHGCKKICDVNLKTPMLSSHGSGMTGEYYP